MNKVIYRFIYVFWLLGLILPALYLWGIFQLKLLVKVVKKDPWIKLSIIFLFLQTVILISAVRFDFFTWERFYAGLHNIASFGFILVGFAVMSDKKIRERLSYYSGEILMAMLLLIFIGSGYSLLMKEPLMYPGLLEEWWQNKFTNVQFNRIEDKVIENFPRTRVLGIYSSTTAMLLMSLFLIYINHSWNRLTRSKGNAIHAAFLIAMLFTGSRIYIVTAIALAVLYQIKSIDQYKKWVKMIPFALLLIVPALVAIFFLRTGSNSTRMVLYEQTISFWIENSFLFGVGIKPYLSELSSVIPYPLGSHSTILGYFFKNGLFIGSAVLAGYILFIKKYIVTLFAWFKGSKKFVASHLYHLSGLTLLLLTTFIEDIDAFEIVPLFLGFVIWHARRIFQSSLESNLFEAVKTKGQDEENDFSNKLVTFLNPYSYLISRKNVESIQKFDVIYQDGISLVWLMKLLGVKSKRKSFDMTSMAPELFNHCISDSKTIYFIGAKGDEVAAAVENIIQKFTGLKVVGFRDGYVANNIQKVCDEIITIKPDYVVAGMGTPLQEEFLLSLRERGFVGGGFTCGGFLHQTALGIEYYPNWANRFHLRWFYRILDEPKLISRYLIKYPISVYFVIRDWFWAKF